MRASDLIQSRDYPNFPEFQDYGIPLHLVDAEAVLFLQRFRVDTGIPMIPSPVREGWARQGGSPGSRHYAIGRLSDAGDVFPARGRLLDAWVRLQEYPEVGGLGLYGDTNGPDGRPWPMFHFDLRPVQDRTEGKRVLWVREHRSVYHYLHRDPRSFWPAFGRLIGMGA